VTAGVGNYVTDNPSNLGKYMTADTSIDDDFGKYPLTLGHPPPARQLHPNRARFRDHRAPTSSGQSS
jgi:hypothetical protein